MRFLQRRVLLGLAVLLWPLAAGCDLLGGEDAPAAPAASRQAPPVAAMVAVGRLQSLEVGVATVGSLRSPETTVISADVSGIIVGLDARGRQRNQEGPLDCPPRRERGPSSVAGGRGKTSQCEDRTRPGASLGRRRSRPLHRHSTMPRPKWRRLRGCWKKRARASGKRRFGRPSRVSWVFRQPQPGAVRFVGRCHHSAHPGGPTGARLRSA